MKYLLLIVLSGCVTAHIVDDRLDPSKVSDAFKQQQQEIEALAKGQVAISEMLGKKAK